MVDEPTTPSEESQPTRRSRFGEARERFATRLQWWADEHLRWLWRRLGSYCNCRQDILSSEGIREKYLVRIGHARTSYDVERANLFTPKSSERCVVLRHEMVRFPYTRRFFASTDVLCSCGGWIPTTAHPGDWNVSGESLRWTDHGIRRMINAHAFHSVSSAERRIDQITGREGRIRNWLRWGLDLTLIAITLFAVLRTSSTPAPATPVDPATPPNPAAQTDTPAP